jgi:hypothetical protein
MKNVLKAFGIIALVAIIGFSFTACGGDDGGNTGGGDKDLPGTITISPSTGVTTGTKLTATYSGSETVSYQWKNGSTNVGTNSREFTPTEAGSYTVTVSAEDYKSKTSVAVTVTGDTPDLKGIITVNPTGPVQAGTKLTAKYEYGSERVSFQWKKDGSNVTTTYLNGWEYMPTESGSYTVTVSAEGYNPKTSAAVTVTPKWTAVTGTSGGGLTGQHIYAITYANNKFVAGSSSGLMATSTDGITWTGLGGGVFAFYSSVVSKYADILTITYGNNMFVAGGSFGKMATSPDGTSWTAVTQSIFDNNAYIYGIAYGNSKFVAVSDGGEMATSPDGTTWTAVTQSIFNAGISAITYANDKFVAVGGGGKMATSTDGTTWTAVEDSKFGTDKIRAIAFCNDKFFAGGDNGKMATSTDGTTWTAVTDSGFGTNNIYTIAYGNGKFVAGGYYERNAFSSDGITWIGSSSGVVTNTNASITAIVYGNNKFVAVGSDGILMYSTGD